MIIDSDFPSPVVAVIHKLPRSGCDGDNIFELSLFKNCYHQILKFDSMSKNDQQLKAKIRLTKIAHLQIKNKRIRKSKQSFFISPVERSIRKITRTSLGQICYSLSTTHRGN